MTVLALALIMSSCLKDIKNDRSHVDKNDNRVTFVVSISVPTDPAARAIPNGSPEDNRVDEITILLFDATTLKYVNFVRVENPDIEDNVGGNVKLKKFSAVIPGGNYKALVTANAASFIDAKYNLTAGTIVGGGDMEDLTIAQVEEALNYQMSVGGKYNANPSSGSYRPFVMSSKREDFNFPLTDKDKYAKDPIPLARDVARINVRVNSSPTSGNSLTLSEIKLYNYNRNFNVAALPAWWDPAAWGTGVSTPLFSTAVTRTATLVTAMADAIVYSGADIGSNECVDEIFTAESPAASNLFLLVKANVTVKGAVYTDRWFKLDFRAKDLDDSDKIKMMNILRNYSYNLNIIDISSSGYATEKEAYDNPPAGLIVELEATPEDGMFETTYNGVYQLTVDRSLFVLPAIASEDIIRIFTDYAGGWKIVENSAGWLTPSLTETFAANPSGTSNPVTLAVTANTTGAVRETTFVVTAGNLRKTVTVRQLPENNTPVPTNMTMYVGAFWKHDQKGERLIRISRSSTDIADGAWRATVVVGADWIMLDTNPSLDNIGSPAMSGNDAAFETTHYLKSGTTSVTGTLSASTPEIYFRIGLQNAIAAGTHRYGLVALTYKDNTAVQHIWIRQGEEADYLMNYDDPVGGGSGLRPNAIQVSPYNLTASSFSGGYASLPHRGGIFTAYPTQAGAMFQWASTSALRRAFAPVGDVGSGWNQGVPSAGSGYWASMDALHEVCPPGYYRLHDGTIFAANPTGAVAGSSARQSLWLNPQTGAFSNTQNSDWGYYADGYFDRRTPANSATGVPFSVVATGNDVAYVGRVFYNTTTSASVFFPAAGYRNSGTLAVAGAEGHYTTAASQANTTIWGLTMSSSTAGMMINERAEGLTIRCVASSFEILPYEILLSADEHNPAVAPNIISVLTSDVNRSWTLTVPSDAQSWLHLSVNGSTTFGGAGTSVSGTGPATIYVYATANPTPFDREALLYLDGDPSDVRVEVKQEANMELWKDHPWVGTFHRNSEKGERFIYGRNTGDWSATIVAGNDWIRIDGGDENVRNRFTDIFVNGNIGNAEDYLVTGMGAVNSTGNILFRVGTSGTQAAGTAPRYGKIRVDWNEDGAAKQKFLYVRQGETDDFGPGQTSGTKWSPYNVGKHDSHALYPISGNGFVDYPTQSGYFYRWSYSETVSTPVSYNPVVPLGAPTGWVSTINGLYALDGVCPPGYDVPTGNKNVPSNDMSLLVSAAPAATAQAWGYYADGFFDRRAVNLNTEAYGINGYPRIAVEYNSDRVAYVGRLFFNDATNASLFFPAAGYRNESGDVRFAGRRGIYTSKDTYTDGPNPLWEVGAWMLDFNTSYDNGSFVGIQVTDHDPITRLPGTIRCVKDDTPVTTPITNFDIDLATNLGKTTGSPYANYDQAPNKWKKGGTGPTDYYMVDKIVVSNVIGATPTVFKWAAGTQNAAWFASNGTAFTLANGIPVMTDGTYSVYIANGDGGVVKTITAASIRDGSTARPFLLINYSRANTLETTVTNISTYKLDYLQTANLSKDFELYENITMPAPVSGNNWVMAGTLTGLLEGNNHSIDELTMDLWPFVNNTTPGAALLGMIDGGTVQNLALTNVNLRGGIVGGSLTRQMDNSALVENCFVTGIIRGTSYVGGITGSLEGGATIRNCYTTVDVRVETSVDTRFAGAGGIASSSETSAGHIVNCFATGTITTIPERPYVSGIIGYLAYSTNVLNKTYALNSTITSVVGGSGYRSRRVWSSGGGGQISTQTNSSYGYTGMVLDGGATTATPNANGFDGADITFAQATSITHYQTTGGWLFDGAGPWTFTYTAGSAYVGAGTNLPILKSFMSTVPQNPLLVPDVGDLPIGTGGTATGKLCYDIAETGVTQPTRALEGKTNFALRTVQGIGGNPRLASPNTYSGIQTYRFTATTANVSNVRYEIQLKGGTLSSVGDVIDSATPLSGTLQAGNLANGSSVNLNVAFRNNLNTALRGVTYANATVISLHFIYYDNAQGKDVRVTADISIQDSGCCGACTSPGVWREFMCHNLGANTYMEPLVAAMDLNGNYYQWGSRTPAAYGPPNGDAVIGSWNMNPPSTYWGNNTSSATQTVKSANDPCPTGYRVPNQSEWTGVSSTANNTQKNTGTWVGYDGNANAVSGKLFGTSLHLPGAGYRHQEGTHLPAGSLDFRGYGAYYWSSTMNSSTSAYNLGFDQYSAFVYDELNGNPRAAGFSVRCIAEY